jgi:hypothetical protein
MKNSVKCTLLSFLAVLAPVLVSCTSVSFPVEHPPMVDLRNANTITVIPLEWNSNRRNEHLSRAVTSALINGLRMGKVEYVDPQVLKDNPVQNYWKYADVYITGRMIDAKTSRSVETKTETDWNSHSGRHENVSIKITTITTTVEIEYSYIRSVDNVLLGFFRKTETGSVSYEHMERRNESRRSNQYSGRREGAPRAYQPGRGLDTGTAEAAIAKFSYTMAHELGPYTTTEERNIKAGTGNNRRAAEANRFIRQDRYQEALAIYSDIYKQNSNAAAGYNTAILLAANKKYADALALLTNLQNRTENAGEKSPSFIRKEIKKLTEFINGFKILDVYRKNEAGSNAIIPVNVPETPPQTVSAKITGTSNINDAVVYALTGPISSVNDPSVFTKMLAYTNASKGQWSMDIPNEAPASLWFLLIDKDRYYYISKTPLNTSATVVLNSALMNKLEEQ